MIFAETLEQWLSDVFTGGMYLAGGVLLLIFLVAMYQRYSKRFVCGHCSARTDPMKDRTCDGCKEYICPRCGGCKCRAGK